MFDIPEKHWITFHDLYPCIIQDPLQIYLKYHLHYPSSSHIHTNNKKLQYFEQNKHKLFFLSDKYRKDYYHFFLQKIIEHQYDFFSIPVFNHRYKWKSIIDMIVRYKYIDAHSDDDRYIIIIMIESDMISEYKKYQAYFYSMILNHNKNIITDKIFFLHLNTLTFDSIIIHEKHYHKNISSYCRWIRNCMNYGSLYKLDPPSHPNLYPNMKIKCDDPLYQDFKTRLSQSIYEITLLWRCHPKHREIMHKKGIYSYMDKNFDVSLLGFSDKHTFILQKMIEMIKNKDGPNIYIGNHNVLQESFSNEFYIDFETLNDIIYWIGIGYWNGKEYCYQSFISSEPTLVEQHNIMKQTKDFLDLFSEKRVYYWYAEKRFWNRVINHIDMDFSYWIDMCQIFQDTPILIKHAFDFKLKTIINSLYHLGVLNITCPNECQNGIESMILAHDYYNSKDPSIFNILKKYNEFDCRSMFELKQYILSII